MIKNVGNIDRWIRVVIAVVLGSLVLTGTIAGTWAVIAGIVAVVLALTGFTNFCPLYKIISISTTNRDE